MKLYFLRLMMVLKGKSNMQKGKVVSLEDRIPQIKQLRRRKANRRLIFLLSIFFLLIVIIIYFQSPLSQIKQIEIVGSELIQEDTILFVSDLQSGDNIWKMDKNQVKENLLALQEMKDVDIHIRFPNDVVIQLEEYAVIGYLADENDLLPILENGVILEHADRTLRIDGPILSDFQEGDILFGLVQQLSELPPEITQAISEIRYEPKETDQYHIYMFMNDGFEVNATIPTLSEKLVHYPSIVSQLDPNVKGVIDIEVGSFFKAFEMNDEEKSEEDEG